MPHRQWQRKSTNCSTNQYCGSLAIPIFNEAAEIEFMNSSKITSELTAYDNMDKKVNTEIKNSIEEKYKNAIERLTTEMNDKEKRIADISTLTGVSNWLTVLPITEFGFEWSKQPFWDSIRLRYGWENM